LKSLYLLEDNLEKNIVEPVWPHTIILHHVYKSWT